MVDEVYVFRVEISISEIIVSYLITNEGKFEIT